MSTRSSPARHRKVQRPRASRYSRIHSSSIIKVQRRSAWVRAPLRCCRFRASTADGSNSPRARTRSGAEQIVHGGTQVAPEPVAERNHEALLSVGQHLARQHAGEGGLEEPLQADRPASWSAGESAGSPRRSDGRKTAPGPRASGPCSYDRPWRADRRAGTRRDRRGKRRPPDRRAPAEAKASCRSSSTPGARCAASAGLASVASSTSPKNRVQPM